MPARKFLFIAYYYPPVNAIGAVRAAKFAKYLPAFGWEPVVLTRQWEGADLPDVPGVRVVRTAYQDRLRFFRRGSGGPQAEPPPTAPAASGVAGLRSRLRRLVSFWLKEAIAYPDEFIGWKPLALQAARQVIEQDNIALIFSTATPFTSHLVAAQLHREYGLPWVADFRDPWTQSPVWHHSWLRTRVERGLERRTMRRADLLATVSHPWAEGLGRFHGKPVAVIPNGYDEDDYAGPPPPLTPDFTITYTGRLYAETYRRAHAEGRRDPTPLFAAVRELVAAGEIDPARFKIRFYGPEQDRLLVLALAGQHGLQGVVSHEGEVAFPEAVCRQRESTVLLLLNWQSARNSFKEQGWFTAKVYEYFGARRPILALPCHGGVDALLRETGSGVSATTPEEVAQAIRAWYSEFLQNGRVAYTDHGEVARRYTRQHQAGQLAQAFDRVVAES